MGSRPGSEPIIEIPAVDAIERALQTGDAHPLRASDALTLLERATRLAEQLQAGQARIMANVYGTTALDQTLSFGKNSVSATASMPSASLMSVPFITGENGTGMAALAEVGSGRGMVYGVNVLAWMAAGNNQPQHAPLFKRAFTWLMTGDANAALPATIKFGTAGYSAGDVTKYIASIGGASQFVTCDIANVANTCWQNMDLMVFNGGVTASAGLTELVSKYLAAGKSVIYMNGSWSASAGAVQVASAMGVTLGGAAGGSGNFYAGTAAYSVEAGRTTAQSQAKADKIGSLVTTLRMLANDSLAHDFSADQTPTTPIDKIQTDLSIFDGSGVSVFSRTGTELYRLLVLWADLYRPNIVYGAGLSKTGNAAAFLRAYASDSWTVYNRSATTVSPRGQGSYMPVAAQSLPVIADEEVVVTIAQASGKTAIGRAAVPGKPITIEILEARDGSNYGVQTSHLRAVGSPFNATYAHPRRPQSFAVALPRNKATAFVTPFGGPLFLNYSGATAGSTVKLRIKGGAKYAHFDFSGATPSAEEVADAVAALGRQDFGWMTAKMVGGEIQQTIAFAKKVVGTKDPKVYVVDELKGILFDSNHIANGYNNMPMAANVKSRCDSLGWTCDGAMHAAPSVQHFVGWIAQCGFLCSGNPSDGAAGIDLGWGWAHELGHNTVQRVMRMDFGKNAANYTVGCVTECDNNNLAVAQSFRAYDVLGLDQNAGRVDHRMLFDHIKASRATNLQGDALRADMTARFWGVEKPQAKMAFWMQLTFLYTKERLGMAKPTSKAALEFYTLLTKGDRLVAKAWDAANPGKYGMSRYANNTITNQDLLFVLSSKIIGKDLTNVFAMYGMPLSQTALDSVADLKLPMAERNFYAMGVNMNNQISTGQWISLESPSTAYPF